MSNYTQQPSKEADENSSHTSCDHVETSKVTIASEDDVKTSLAVANRKTEVWTLSERLNNIEKMVPLPKLTSSNWNHWYESVQLLLYLTETACVFLSDFPTTKATLLWSAWWNSKLRESAPQIRTGIRESPLAILTSVVVQTQATLRTNLMTVRQRFWTFQAIKNMSIQTFVKEYEKRYNDLKDNNVITSEMERQMKHLLSRDNDDDPPNTIQQARQSQNYENWEKAIQAELDTLKKK
ncbi:putative serine threonine protein kinase domain protein [Erysiphe necator]|uniref:Putative serine threonine protein kinase domain protein n=1 Tax=Uncinula necator TaxID=52586 RepID=A0A0B1P270_UNCNE|nr:putative serine threonine protein kinase domain protein [Erysiphe necator]